MSNLFKSPPPPPAPIPPPPMPDPFGPAALEAKRQAMANATQGGRNSTILTTQASRGNATLAGNAFAGTKTGA